MNLANYISNSELSIGSEPAASNIIVVVARVSESPRSSVYLKLVGVLPAHQNVIKIVTEVHLTYIRDVGLDDAHWGQCSVRRNDHNFSKAAIDFACIAQHGPISRESGSFDLIVTIISKVGFGLVDEGVGGCVVESHSSFFSSDDHSVIMGIIDVLHVVGGREGLNVAPRMYGGR